MTTVSYHARINHTIRGMQPALDQVYAQLGYLGAVACAAFLTAPVGARVYKPWASYSLLLWNSFLCPPFEDVATAAWPSGALRFGCWPSLPDQLMRSHFPTKTTYVGEAEATGIYNQEAYLGRDATRVSHWQSHVWACTRTPAGPGRTTNFTLRPRSLSGVMTGHDSIHHVHLPRRACSVVHAAISGQPALWLPLRAIHGYQVATDPTDHGKHGLMHEFGVYVARRVLHDDDALSGAWNLFSLFYLTPAPIHSFLSTVFAGRTEVGGLQVEDWALRFCDHFLRNSTMLGAPALSDPPLHLFGECIHGIGHGMAVRFKLNITHGHTPVFKRGELPVLAAWSHACEHIGARFDQLERPPAFGNLSAFFRYACVMGIRHHVRNNALGQDVQIGPGSKVGNNASNFLSKMINELYCHGGWSARCGADQQLA